MNFSEFIEQEINKASGWGLICIFGVLIILGLWIGYILANQQRERALRKMLNQ